MSLRRFVRVVVRGGLALFWCSAFWGSLPAGGAKAAESALQVAPGFEARDRLLLPGDAITGGFAYDPGEDFLFIAYVGSELRRYGDGASVLLLGFPADPPVFGSFVRLAPEGGAVFFGESSAGNIHRVPLDGAQPVVHDNIPFNYDLDFDPAGRGFVSTGAGGAQRIVLLDADPSGPLKDVIVGIPGFSGPLVFDPAGNLYYGTADFDAPAQSLHRFTPDELAAALADGPIDFASGETVASEIDGLAYMVWLDGKIYFSDLGFASPPGKVGVIDPASAFAVSVLATVAAGEAFTSPTFLAARPGSTAFAPGSGAAGGALAVVYGDFANVHAAAEITPQRFFVRGRVNDDDTVDISDATALLNFLFLGGSAPDPLEAGDVNNDGDLDISDAVYLLNFLFLGGPDVPPPYPDPGPDPGPGG